MDFGKEGFISGTEEEQMMGKGKLPFSYSSSSSSQQLAPSITKPHQIYHKSPNWLGSRAAPDVPEEEEHNEPRTEAYDDSDKRVDSADSTSIGLRSSTTSAASGSNSNSIEKEHMFDKVVTPSDVGKLNRLVIPKQYAEKYFPMDSSANEKGLLLNFEDRNGKPWRFRYSYWNSSQSYVMTKGWSRFVKDKKLDAGDIVSFQRGLGELGKDRLFIDWRRRPDADKVSFHYYSSTAGHSRSVPWSPLLMRPPPQTGDHMHLSHINYPLSRNFSYYSVGGGGGYNNNNNNPSVVSNPMGSSVFYLRSAAAAAPNMGMMEWQRQVVGGGIVEPVVFDSVPVVQGKAAAKRFRLFGVNMECPPAIPESSTDDDCVILTANPAATMPISSQLPPPHHHQLISSSSSSHHHHPLQLRLYNGTPLPASSTHDFLNANKGKANSSLSLDLDM